MRRISQYSSEDVFSAFENSFAAAIDPHTNYFGPVESENFNDDMNLSLEGIGAVLSQEDEYTVIVQIMPGSPAEKSKKLKPKDKIVAVKQEHGKFEDIIGWRLTEVVKRLKVRRALKLYLKLSVAKALLLRPLMLNLHVTRLDFRIKRQIKGLYLL